MKERPVLFSGSMVRAILEGRKTQTRRVIKPQPEQLTLADTAGEKRLHWCVDHSDPKKRAAWPIDDAPFWTHCPYGQPGDRLWVREAYSRCGCNACYMAWPDKGPHGITAFRATHNGPSGLSWRPSIFLPRWASRITLEITGARVQRLQEISAVDAEAEGVFAHVAEHSIDKVFRDLRGAEAYTYFGELWESINGKGSWNANPWVWALTFRSVT